MRLIKLGIILICSFQFSAFAAKFKSQSTTISVKQNSQPPAGVEWKGVTPAMWSEINSQRAVFGDTNDCKARIDSLPTTGFVLPPGGDIASALAANNVVILQTGVYNISARFGIPPGKKLIGGPGQNPIIDATGFNDDSATVFLGDNSVFTNIVLRNTPSIGIVTYNLGGFGYSNGALIYRVVVHSSGMDQARKQKNGSGIVVTGGSYNTCVVSAEVYDTYNILGTDGSNTSITAHGGNSDGIVNSYGAYNNSFIDVHAHNAGDDGFDMWEGGQTYWYFSVSHDNGKNSVFALTGDGNGIKLGIGNISHKFYKVDASNNKEGGWDLNGNTQQPKMVQCAASGNSLGNYVNGLIPP